MLSNAIAHVICTVSPPSPFALMPKSLRTRTTTQEIWILAAKKTAQSKNLLQPSATRQLYLVSGRVVDEVPLMARLRRNMKPRMDSQRYPMTIFINTISVYSCMVEVFYVLQCPICPGSLSPIEHYKHRFCTRQEGRSCFPQYFELLGYMRGNQYGMQAAYSSPKSSDLLT